MPRTARTGLPRRPRLGTRKPSSLKLTGARRRGTALAGTALALSGVGAATAAAVTSGTAQATPVTAAVRVTHTAPADSALAPGTLARSTPASSAPVPVTAAFGAAAVVTAASPARTRTAHLAKAAGTSWREIRDKIARDTLPRARPGTLPLADRLEAGPAHGQQTFMPVSGAQLSNATAIVRGALDMHMGLRSAVIAVATAMQESGLQNISYGDRDSLGLFQQRPSCGWGTAAQLTNPPYAARAFLTALHKHQQSDPGWASQPLWASAQAVQNSGFPTAYAKWEAQAAQLVTAIARHLA